MRAHGQWRLCVCVRAWPLGVAVLQQQEAMSLSILFSPAATMRKTGGLANLAKSLRQSRISVHAMMASTKKPEVALPTEAAHDSRRDDSGDDGEV